jgi:hypothetical protein
MALTALWDQQMKAIELDKLFDKRRAEYKAMAIEAYAYTKSILKASGESVRQDDVALHLQAQIELDEALKAHLDKKKKAQQYWPKRFTFLILDRLWEELDK